MNDLSSLSNICSIFAIISNVCSVVKGKKIPATDLFLMAGTSYYFVIIVTFNNPYAIRIKIYFCGIPVNKKNNNKYQQ